MTTPRMNPGLRNLLISWIVVGVPAAIGYLTYFISQMQPWNTILDAIKTGLFWALVTGLIFGTLGYGLLRAARNGRRTELDYILLGDDGKEATRWLRGAIALFAITFVGLLALNPENVAVREQSVPVGIGLGLTIALPAVMAIVGALHAYRNRGLLITWAVVFAPTSAFWIAAFALPASPDLIRQASDVIYAGGLALGLAAAMGSVSYLLGAELRQIFNRNYPPTPGGAID